MPVPVEYHISVRRSVLASVALFGVFALSALFIPSSHAQTNGVPASVTSPGFGGRAINGTAPSVSSVGPRGYTSNGPATFTTQYWPSQGNGHHGDGHHGDGHHHHYVTYVPPFGYYAPLPYAVDIGATEDDADADDDANYQGGPTIFDRRGNGAQSYVPPVEKVLRPHEKQNDEADSSESPEPPQEPTLLVFKDGHKIEVGNYAIIGATLFDLTPGHARKIALADLDLDATQKQNDDRGVIFRLPMLPQAN
jgi:hypothetical protein